MQPTSWLMLIEAVVIVAVNIITIAIFTATRRLRSRQYALIVSLAVADLLIGLVSVPLNIVSQELGPRSPTFGNPSLIQDTVFGAASLFGLAALAIERAHATYFPFNHHTLSKGHYALGISTVWVLIMGYGIAIYYSITYTSYYILIKIITAATTLIVICGAYFLIVVKVRCMARASNQATSQGNKKLTVTLSIVTIISLLAWIPYQALLLAWVLFGNSVISSLYWDARAITKVLHYSNSLANFFVYAFRMREFKVELLRKFRCGTRQVSPNDDSTRARNSMKSASVIDAPIPLQSQ